MIVNNLIKYINLLVYYDKYRLCIHCSYIIYPFILQSIQIRYGRVQYVKTSSITTSKYLKTLHDIFAIGVVAIGVVTTTGTPVPHCNNNEIGGFHRSRLQTTKSTCL